jgi:deoxyinosine 3'endonuclease (endonuclease V)
MPKDKSKKQQIIEVHFDARQAFGSDQPLDALKSQWEAEQADLAKQVKFDPTFDCDQQQRSGGLDISFVKNSDKAVVCLAVHNVQTQTLLAVFQMSCTITIPYAPGFMAYREVPAYLEILNYVKTNHPTLVPGFIVVDGNGYWHPRRCGSASMLSLRSDTPCIGVAKKLLCVENIDRETVKQIVQQGAPNEGDVIKIHTQAGDELGAIYNANGSAKSLRYISVGSGMTLQAAINMVTQSSTFSNNESVRQADLRSRETCRQVQTRAPVVAVPPKLSIFNQNTAQTTPATSAQRNEFEFK